jgi:hypothetical protein
MKIVKHLVLPGLCVKIKQILCFVHVDKKLFQITVIKIMCLLHLKMLWNYFWIDNCFYSIHPRNWPTGNLVVII